MSCLYFSFASYPVIPLDEDYYKELLFNQILKDKKITEDSFDKLYFISKNFKISGISDTNGNFSFIVAYGKGGAEVISTDEIKKKQLKIEFSKTGFWGDGWMIIDYE